MLGVGDWRLESLHAAPLFLHPNELMLTLWIKLSCDEAAALAMHGGHLKGRGWWLESLDTSPQSLAPINRRQLYVLNLPMMKLPRPALVLAA